MKTRQVVILILATCGCIGSLVAGAFFHEDILSLFDGVYPLDPTHGRMVSYDPKEGTTRCWTRDDWVQNLATPAGFEISPSTAGDILTGRRWRHGTIKRAYIFADNEGYYFVNYGYTFPDTGSFIPNHPGWRFFRQDSPYHAIGPSSYYAKLFGTRINGKDGTIWDRIVL